MTTLTAMPSLITLEPPTLPNVEFVYRFTRDEFRKLEESGVLGFDRQFELIHGLLVEIPVANPIHDGCLRRINQRVTKLVPEGYFLQLHGSLALSDSEPIPDASVIRGGIEDFDREHPEPSHTAIAIEVSNTSLRFDQKEKRPLYAESDIPVYWIIDVNARQIEVYSDPEPFKMTYATQAVYKPGDAVPIVLDGQTVATIPVSDLLP